MKQQNKTLEIETLNEPCEFIYSPASSISIGLNYGTTRKMITYGALFKHKKNLLYHDEVLNCLKEIFEQSDTIEEFDYFDGALGVGWGIEWMIQNHLLDPSDNIEEIDNLLESIDQIITRFVAYANLTDISLNSGIIGYLKYMERRFKSISSQSHRFKLIGLLEVIVMLTDDLFSSIENLETTDLELRQLVEMGNVYRSITQAALPVNQQTVEKTINLCEKILRSEIAARIHSITDYNEILDLLYVSVTFYIGAKTRFSVNNKIEAQNYINILLKRLKFDSTLSNYDLYRQSQILTLLLIYFKDISLQMEYNLILDNFRKTSQGFFSAEDHSQSYDDSILLNLAINKELHCLEELIYF